eukprot:s1442_g13.t1
MFLYSTLLTRVYLHEEQIETEWGKSAQHHCWELNPDPAVFSQNQYFGVYHPRKNMEDRGNMDWLACREQTGVPKFISKDDKKMALKIAGPGKVDKILGKKYEVSPREYYSTAAVGAFVAMGIAGVATMAFGSFVLRSLGPASADVHFDLVLIQATGAR